MALRWLAVVVPALVVLADAGAAQDAAPTTRSFTVVARDGRFEPDELQVTRNDLVRITLQSTDAPVSFAIDAYRLMKRAGAGETVTFAFRADRAGRFPYYCSLSSDDHCRSMRGTLVVTER
ncbi:MAG: cupredoxin domain-containing protein [Vicinamibacterales bacterium]